MQITPGFVLLACLAGGSTISALPLQDTSGIARRFVGSIHARGLETEAELGTRNFFEDRSARDFYESLEARVVRPPAANRVTQKPAVHPGSKAPISASNTPRPRPLGSQVTNPALGVPRIGIPLPPVGVYPSAADPNPADPNPADPNPVDPNPAPACSAVTNDPAAAAYPTGSVGPAVMACPTGSVEPTDAAYPTGSAEPADLAEPNPPASEPTLAARYGRRENNDAWFRHQGGQRQNGMGRGASASATGKPANGVSANTPALNSPARDNRVAAIPQANRFHHIGHEHRPNGWGSRNRPHGQDRGGKGNHGHRKNAPFGFGSLHSASNEETSTSTNPEPTDSLASRNASMAPLPTGTAPGFTTAQTGAPSIAQPSETTTVAGTGVTDSTNSWSSTLSRPTPSSSKVESGVKSAKYTGTAAAAKSQPSQKSGAGAGSKTQTRKPFSQSSKKY